MLKQTGWDKVDCRTYCIGMHPDRKIGIAMGILLVGVVAALFFRNEPLPLDEPLSMRREDELNERLRERDVAIYLEPDSNNDVGDRESKTDWALSDILGQADSGQQARPIAIHSDDTTADAQSHTESPTFKPPQRTVTTEPASPDSNVQVSDKRPRAVQSSQESTPQSAMTASEPVADNLSQPEFQEYKVQYGDTLSGISERFLGSHHRYQELYEMNRDRINNPDRLRVGTAIRVPRAIH